MFGMYGVGPSLPLELTHHARAHDVARHLRVQVRRRAGQILEADAHVDHVGVVAHRELGVGHDRVEKARLAADVVPSTQMAMIFASGATPFAPAAVAATRAP
jgi:hypothetical protein